MKNGRTILDQLRTINGRSESNEASGIVGEI
jgi:hypothetical protein